MMLRMGQNPTLVISSTEATKDMMKTHDIVFSNRPEMTAANILFYGCRDIGFAHYGEYWRQAKKICVIELLSNKMVQSFQYVRGEETAILNDRTLRACLSGASVYLTEMLNGISNRIVSRPIIGNIHQLGKLLHRSLLKLSDQYGPLMMLCMGQNPTLVISSAEATKDMMKTHDIVFSNRPEMTAANILFYGWRDIGFAHYGEYWRQAKKICVVELLSNKMVQSFQSVRGEETAILNDRILRACLSGASVNLTEMLNGISNRIVSRCTLGWKAEEDRGNDRLGKLTRRVVEQFMAFSFGDVFPSLSWMDNLTGMVSRLKEIFKELDALLDQAIEEHKKLESVDNQSREKDFVDVLLQLQKDGVSDVQFTQDNLKAILMEMFLAGTDNSATTIEWLMAELMKDQNFMKKAQEEVRRIVGKKSKIEARDIDGVSYLKCVIKETLRLHPPVPLITPRDTISSVEFGGYHIPPKTRVLVNAFAIQRDPKLWERPDDFIPERFMYNPVDFKDLDDFKLIPFGGGRRGCPGIASGIAVVEYVIANLLQWFDWKLPSGAIGEDLDMSEVNGLTVHKKISLHLVPTMYNSL